MKMFNYMCELPLHHWALLQIKFQIDPTNQNYVRVVSFCLRVFECVNKGYTHSVSQHSFLIS